MLLNLEHRPLLLHEHAEADVDVLCLEGFLLVVAVVSPKVRFVVCVLDELPCPRSIEFGVDAVIDKLLVEFVSQPVFASEVYHWSRLTVLGNHIQCRYAGGFGYSFVVGTEGRRDMYYSCTIVGGDIIAADDAEGVSRAVGDAVQLLVVVYRLDPGEELLVFEPDEFSTLATPKDIRLQAVALFVGGVELLGIGGEPCLGKDID